MSVGTGGGVELGAMGGAVAIYTPAESGVGLGGAEVAVRTGTVVGSGVDSGAEVGDGGGVDVGTSVGTTARDTGAGVGMDMVVSGTGTMVAVGGAGSGAGDGVIRAEACVAIGSPTDCS